MRGIKRIYSTSSIIKFSLKILNEEKRIYFPNSRLLNFLTDIFNVFFLKFNIFEDFMNVIPLPLSCNHVFKMISFMPKTN